MMKEHKMKCKGFCLWMMFLLFACTSFAQTGIGTQTPNPDASLELGASDKGLLLNRVALTGTADPTPLSAHVAGMTVYNTATAGDVTPGYYYNNGTQWVGIGSPDEEPFRNVSDSSAATNASTDIYYGGGNVGIGTNNPVNRLTISGIDDNQPQALITSPSSAITGNYGIAYRALGVGGVWTGYLGNNPNIPLPGAAVIAGSGKNLYLMAGNQTDEGNAMDPSDPGNVPRITVLESNGNVGIGTTTPGATLEVVGNPANTNAMDGVIPPKITGDQLAAKTYTASQVGAIVYVTSTPGSQTGQVINVNQEGVYAFNGAIWVKLAATSVGFIPSITATGQSVPLTQFQPTGVGWPLTNQLSLRTGSGLDATGTFTAPASGFYQINMHAEYRAPLGQTITFAIGSTLCTDPCTDSNGISLNNFTTRGAAGVLNWNSLNTSGILYMNVGESIGAITLFRGGGASFDSDHRVRNINIVIQHVGV